MHVTKTRTWRHLDFFEHQTYLHGRIPWIICSKCGVREVNVPWVREKSGFTLFI
ncbi:transposase family protein [Methanospirillum purgamenti]|uniref:Transposase family protein n=1 Tax=Methanospirillum hungatei TaxID=2203 RepID=A0A8F5VNK0_METHU|nr:transposase family protein [Methanospirillum hungatei]